MKGIKAAILKIYKQITNWKFHLKIEYSKYYKMKYLRGHRWIMIKSKSKYRCNWSYKNKLMKKNKDNKSRKKNKCEGMWLKKRDYNKN